MAGSTPIYGLPYPQASDLVADYPALGEDLAEKLDEKLPSYQSVAPTSPSVGQIWIDSDDDIGRVWDGAAWLPFSGAGTLSAGDVSATTGSPTITTTGIYTVYSFTGSGSITFAKAGLTDVVMVGGGTGGSAGTFGVAGSGGTGSFALADKVYLPASTLTVTIGAGGSGTFFDTDGDNSGTASKLGELTAAYSQYVPKTRSGVGGLGLGARGGNTGSADGGTGLTSTLTGASVTYAGGGGAGPSGTGTDGGGNGANNTSGSAAAANRGGGGGGCTGTSSTGGNGGSGVVIIRVVT
jgi:hypothetical protein